MHMFQRAELIVPPPPDEWQRAGIFWYDRQRVHPRQARRLFEIASYFDEHVTTRLLVPVVTATFDVSLRLLDYCCTNYAKKTRIVICQNGTAIHLFSLYKDWLRHYRRRTFDPFRRRERICFANPTKENEWLVTTVAQLNFLRWADVYGVIAFVRKNLSNIEQDMMQTLGDSKKRRQRQLDSDNNESGQKRRRAELSHAPRNKCTVYVVPGSSLFGNAEQAKDVGKYDSHETIRCGVRAGTRGEYENVSHPS